MNRLLLALLLTPAGLAVPAAAQAPDRVAVDRAIERVGPALVRILVAEKRFEDGREEKSEASGSGFIIDAEGHIVTNHHVAGEAKRLICTLANKEQVEADLVGTDALTDIAVIRLRGPRKDYPYARWGDSSRLRVGDAVLAMGSPLALSQSVTRGIVSNTQMVLPDYASGSASMLAGEDVGAMVRWIGHDATIKPGNSGGPLVNLDGEVVGVNEMEMGLAGAIPGNLARSVSANLIRAGRISRAWVGVSAQPMLRASGEASGVLIGGVEPKSPGEKAGLKAGDVVTRIGAKEVSARFAEQLPDVNLLVAGLPVGEPTPFLVVRNGREMTFNVIPEPREEAEPPAREFRPWGLAGGDVSRAIALDEGLKGTEGVLVWSVRPSGPSGSARPRIEGDDVIVAVDRKPVKDVDALEALTRQMVPPGSAATRKVLVTLQRGEDRVVTVVELGRKDEEDLSLEARSAFLAVGAQVLTAEVAEALGVPGKRGVRLTRVDAGSSAEKAGLQVGDIVVAVDDMELEATQPEQGEEFTETIRQYAPGATVTLTLLRQGKPVKLDVKLETSPRSPRELKRFKDDDFEFAARNVAYEDVTSIRVQRGVHGALVESVSDGGWAALGRLQAGDVILSVNGKPTPDIAALEAVMAGVRKDQPHTVVLHVARGARQVFVEMEADWSAAR